MIKDLLAILYPSVCIGCNQTLIGEENHLCTKCVADLPYTLDSFCENNPLLEKFTSINNVKGAASLFHFKSTGTVQKLIHALKYEGNKQLGVWLGTRFCEQVEKLDVDFVLPVPLHKSRLRQRGYNQSEEIAKGLATGISNLKINSSLIKRVKRGITQTRKSRIDRWSSLEGIYSKPVKDISGKRILILDDVITTGATVGHICEMLEGYKNTSIYIGSIARV